LSCFIDGGDICMQEKKNGRFRYIYIELSDAIKIKINKFAVSAIAIRQNFYLYHSCGSSIVAVA
jgi:hypothetical protein